MDYIQALIMGVLQGITEWLPVSSSGQVMLALMNVFSIPPEKAYSYALLMHLGTLMALLFKFRYEFSRILMKLLAFRWEEEETFLFYSTLFTALVGLPIYRAFKGIVGGLNLEAVNAFIGVALIITGLMIKKAKETPIEHIEINKGLKSSKEEVSIVDAIIAGVAQGVAILPGISRSGATIGALLLLGVRQEKAVRLSFLMAIPAISGALFLESTAIDEPVAVSAVAVVSAFIVSLLTLEVMLKLAERLNFSKFCMVFGSIALIASLLGVLV